ncbi:hypothetical protein PM082_003276 [Marasmius tenuissimus]|nr:hypothetical protein PM082_003276 [Marasmius tenuissimus]
MQVAYRPAVVRRLGPSSLQFRSNSTTASTPNKRSYKSASWGDLSLPGRGEAARDRTTNGSLESGGYLCAITAPSPKKVPVDRPRTGSLAERLKHWSKPASKTPENTSPSSAQLSASGNSDRIQGLKVDETRTVDLSNDLTAWNTAVKKLPSSRTRMNSFAGTDWIPGQEFVKEERPPKRAPNSQRPKRDRRQDDNSSASENRQANRNSQASRNGQVSRNGQARRNGQVSRNDQISRNGQRRDTQGMSGRDRSRPFIEGKRSRRRAREIEEEEEEEVMEAALVFTGEDAFKPRPGQTEEEWLTEYLLHQPEPEAPKDPQADVDVASGADDIFATQAPISTIALSVPAAAKVSNASPTRILRRHGGDYAHFLPPNAQNTALKDLHILSHAHLVMGKRREMQFTQKTEAIGLIKRISRTRPQKA